METARDFVVLEPGSIISKILHPTALLRGPCPPSLNRGSVLWGCYFPCALHWGLKVGQGSSLLLQQSSCPQMQYWVSRHSWDFFYYFDSLTFRVSSVTTVWSLSSFKLHTGDLSDTFLLETFSSLGFRDNTHPYSPSSFLAALSSPAIRVSFSSLPPQPLIVRSLSPWAFFFLFLFPIYSLPSWSHQALNITYMFLTFLSPAQTMPLKSRPIHPDANLPLLMYQVPSRSADLPPCHSSPNGHSIFSPAAQPKSLNILASCLLSLLFLFLSLTQSSWFISSVYWFNFQILIRNRSLFAIRVTLFRSELPSFLSWVAASHWFLWVCPDPCNLVSEISLSDPFKVPTMSLSLLQVLQFPTHSD